MGYYCLSKMLGNISNLLNSAFTLLIIKLGKPLIVIWVWLWLHSKDSVHWLFHYFKNIFLLCGKFCSLLPVVTHKRVSENPGCLFLRVLHRHHGAHADAFLLKLLTALTARSSGPLPRPRLVFSRTSGVPVSSLLIKLGLLVSVFPASAPCLFLNIGISPGLCPRQAALPVLQLSPEQT